MWYIILDRPLTREDRVVLSDFITERGYSENIFYHGPGWHDTSLNTLPHLLFLNEEDAIAFSLSCGGKVSTTVPVLGK